MADAREIKTQSLRQKEENSYIREQIVEKKRSPVGTFMRVWLVFLGILVAGGAAGASYAVVNHWLNQGEDIKESVPPHTICYHETSTDDVNNEGDSVDETLNQKDEETTFAQENGLQMEESFVSQKWLDAYLETREYTIEDVEALERALYDVYRTIQKSVVTIQISENAEENAETSKNIEEIFGIIVSTTENEMILLADGNLFTDNTVLTAYPNTQKEQVVEIRQRDSITGITALAISLENFSESDYKNLQAVTLGNSKRINVGDSIILAGSPSGFMGSVQYGYITYIEKNVSTIDGEQKILWTDCVKTEDSSGAMFNLDGELVGWLTSSSQKTDTLQSAIGIEDLTNIIEDVISGKNSAYLGIKGCSVTENMILEYGFPRGIYITEVESKSAAYQSGIQIGDVITAINGTVVASVQGLQNILSSLEEQAEVTIVIQRKGKDGYKERAFTLTLQGR